MKKLFKRILAIAAVIWLFFYVQGFFKKKPAQPMPPRPVETALAVEKDVPVYIDSFGNLYTPNDVDIKAQVTGEIQEVKFDEGDTVKKGDVLFIIDPKPYKATLDKSQAALESDMAQMQLKKDTYERNFKLFEKQLISQQDLDTYKTDYDAAQAQVKLAQADIELAQINLDYCYIAAPIGGITGKRQVDPGNIVIANQGPTLVNIKTIDSLYVDFTIPETRLMELRKAMQEDKLKVQISVENDTAGPYEGQLSLLDNSVDNSTGTVLLRAIVPNENQALWAGQFVDVRLILGTAKNAVLVPYQAVQLGQKGYYVFTVTEDKKADLKIVTPGSRQGEDIVVAKGVQAGEAVVTVGYLGLSPGATVIDAKELQAMKQQQELKEQQKKKGHKK